MSFDDEEAAGSLYTNFGSHKRVQYEQAIEAMGEYKDQVEIREVAYDCFGEVLENCHALHLTPLADGTTRSRFWTQLDKIMGSNPW